LIEILGLAPEKITVTYNAADTFSEPPYKDNSRGKYLLAVSSLNPRKNFKVIIEAFSEIHDDDLQLFIVGGKHSIFNNSDSNQINENSDRVMWLGYVDDDQLSSLYANALAFVYPSLYEGFGLPPLEAMSLGCPVIVSNLTSLPEVCGDAALYIDPFDPSDVANKIEAILNDPKLSDQLIKKGFERNKLFSWKNSTDTFYQEIVNIMANI
jgi:glycosyltransferase involved in cell wall biosynthesis